MDVAWIRGAVTVRDVLEALPSRRAVAYTTAMTVMNRLVRQDCLRRQMGADGAYRYRPTTSRQEYCSTAARQRTLELIRHYGDAALVQFLDTLDRVPNDKLLRLKRQIKRRSR